MKRSALLFSILILSSMLSACGALLPASVPQFTVGECLDDIDAAAMGEHEVVDCADPHRGEVYAVHTVEGADGAPFPGSFDSETYCYDPFEPYVGIPYEESRYFVSPLMPSAETWAAGDREVVCILRDGDSGNVISGSARSSNQ